LKETIVKSRNTQNTDAIRICDLVLLIFGFQESGVWMERLPGSRKIPIREILIGYEPSDRERN